MSKRPTPTPTPSSNPYTNDSRVHRFESDYIHRSSNDVDAEYWRQRLGDILSGVKHGIAINPDSEYTNEEDKSYVFILKHTTGDMIEISKLIERSLKGCRVKHETVNVRVGGNSAGSYETSVTITREMQTRLDAQNRRREWLQRRFNVRDVILLLLFVVIALICLMMLDNHWKDYEDPFHNVKRIIKPVE